MLQVWLLGQFEAREDGRRVLLPSRSAQSLFAYLILSPGTPHRREKLAGLLWPEVPDEIARKNLRHELWRIRKTLASPDSASEYILPDELTLTFNPDADYWLDVAQLSAADIDTQYAVTALNLYRGELLPGLYDDWITLERERVQSLFEGKIHRLLESLIAQQQWHSVIEWAEKWLVHGHTPEPAFRALMVAHAALGDPHQVRRDYERCAAALSADMGVPPSPETDALYNGLVQEQPALQLRVAPLPQSFLAHPNSMDSRTQAPAPGDSPFKGLEYFDEPDADLFFGREEVVSNLTHALEENRSVAIVIGASGSGKSSIVRAGVLPFLRRTAAAGRHWQIHVMTPTARPLEALALALTQHSESISATATLIDDMARDPRSLHLYLKKQAAARVLETKGPSGQSTPSFPLLLVDQFEELFTLCSDEFEREQFIDNLMYALSPSPGPVPTTSELSLVLTLRADFYAQIEAYDELRDLVAQHQYYIGPMNLIELRRAIEEPARQGAADGTPWEFEPGLVDLILRDVGDEPGSLPLLSHALFETWKRRSGHMLTLHGYHDAGGVRGAIAQTAETTYLALGSEEQTIARHLFLRLTELGTSTEDTRRRAGMEELVPQGADGTRVRSVLNQLANARLVTLGKDTAEVAHEALIREWPRLREWLNTDREGLQTHRHLTIAANEWALMERDPGALYRGARLAQAREWAAQNAAALNAQESSFLNASIENEEREALEREVQRERELQAAQDLAETQVRSAKALRRRALFLAGAFFLAVVLAVIALLLGDQARSSAASAMQNERAAQANAEDAVRARDEANAQQRLATARELGANALGNLTVDPELSTLLALRSLKTTQPDNLVLPEAQDALHRAILGLRLEHTLPMDSGVARAMFTPDSTQVLIMLMGGMKRIDLATGRVLAEYPLHPDTMDNINLSPDGAKFAAFDYAPPDMHQPVVLKVFDFESGRLLNEIKMPVTFDNSFFECYSPDWKLIAFPVFNDKSLTIMDLESGQTLKSLEGHTEGIGECTFSPDGQRIATSSLDRTAKIWDVETGKELFTLPGHLGEVIHTRFSPDGKQIATIALDPAVRIWDSETGELLQTLRNHTNNVMSARWSPDGKQFATAGFDTHVTLWDPESWQVLDSFPTHKQDMQDVNFSPDGKRLITASSDRTAKIWDLAPAHELRSLALPLPYRFALSPDQTRAVISELDGTISVWDMASGESILSIPPANDRPYADFMVAFSPDGNRVAAQRSDYTIGIWDIPTGKQIASFTGVPSSPVLFDFSPDGKRFAAPVVPGSGETVAPDLYRVNVWDIETGEVLKTFKREGIIGAKFTPDGNRLATTTWSGILELWDLATGDKIFETTPHSNFVWSIEFSKDGKRILTTGRDRIAKILDAETGEEIRSFTGHEGTIFRAVFSPDEKTIATSSCDKTAKLWDVESGSELLTLHGATKCLYWVDFSLDGKRLITSSDDGGVREYLVDLKDVVDLAKKRLTRAWTPEECIKYLHQDSCPLSP